MIDTQKNKQLSVKEPSEDSYVDTHLAISTVVSGEVMEMVYKDLDNPPSGTAKLGDLLKEIEDEYHRY